MIPAIVPPNAARSFAIPRRPGKSRFATIGQDREKENPKKQAP